MNREQALQQMADTARADYDRVRKQLDDIRARLRATIVDTVVEAGSGSPAHLRLRHALTGEGPGAPSVAAMAAVVANDLDGSRG